MMSRKEAAYCLKGGGKETSVSGRTSHLKQEQSVRTAKVYFVINHHNDKHRTQRENISTASKLLQILRDILTHFKYYSQ